MKCIDLNICKNSIFFDTDKAFISPTQYIYVFLMVPRMNSDYLTVMAMTMNVTVFWDMTSYNLSDSLQYFLLPPLSSSGQSSWL
jgi:hypothetical protein